MLWNRWWKRWLGADGWGCWKDGEADGWVVGSEDGSGTESESKIESESKEKVNAKVKVDFDFTHTSCCAHVSHTMSNAHTHKLGRCGEPPMVYVVYMHDDFRNNGSSSGFPRGMGAFILGV